MLYSKDDRGKLYILLIMGFVPLEIYIVAPEGKEGRS